MYSSAFSDFLPESKTRPHSFPRPLSAGGKFSLGFAKSKSPENSLAKPSPHLNSVSFSLRRNPTSPATTIPKNKKGNRAKQNRMRGGEARVERHSRSGRTRLLACREADAGSWRNSLPHIILEIGSNLVQ